MSVRLEQLLANATSGPWRGEVDSVLWSDEFMVGGFEKWRDAELAALAPDMARLLIDMGEALRWTDSSLSDVLSRRPHRAIAEVHAANEALLDRLDALGKDTA